MLIGQYFIFSVHLFQTFPMGIVIFACEFSDPSKFKKLDKGSSLTQLASLQNDLREIHKRNEIDDSKYTYIYNIHTRTQTDETQTGR